MISLKLIQRNIELAKNTYHKWNDRENKIHRLGRGRYHATIRLNNQLQLQTWSWILIKFQQKLKIRNWVTQLGVVYYSTRCLTNIFCQGHRRLLASSNTTGNTPPATATTSSSFSISISIRSCSKMRAQFKLILHRDKITLKSYENGWHRCAILLETTSSLITWDTGYSCLWWMKSKTLPFLP